MLMTVTSLSTAPIGDTAYGHIEINQELVSEYRLQESDTESIVRSYFRDIPVMIQIARCESTFQHTLSDGSTLQGRVDPADTGVMQINKRYHGSRAEVLELDLDNIYDNMAFARLLYERQGTQPWSASAPCWSPTIAMR